MLIPFQQLLDLPATLESGQAFRWKRLDDSSSGWDGWYEGVIFNNVVRLRHDAAGIEFRCGPDEESAMAPLVADYLRLGDDLDAIYRSINMDKRIGEAIDRFRGLRLIRQEPWECLVSFICSSNSNIRRISTNVEDISKSFGRPIAFDGRERHAFPSPQELAEAGEGPLRELGLGFRAKYVAPVARMVADGEVDLFALWEASYNDALEALTALPGVGDKVANCVMLFSLEKMEAFPVDVWVDRALRDWYLDRLSDNGAETSGKVTKKGMRPWAQGYFEAYAGYANQYLFHDRRLQGRATAS